MRVRNVLGVFCALVGLSAWMPRTVLADPPPGGGYSLAFDEEFNGAALNQNAWNYAYPGSTYGRGRANMQSGPNTNPGHVLVSNGQLTLKATNTRTIFNPMSITDPVFGVQQLDYTSGSIYGKQLFQYGYIEGRFQVPAPTSTWPGFRLLQATNPPELDIFEFAGDPTKDLYTYHYTAAGMSTTLGGVNAAGDFSTGWHIFGVEWTPNTLSWYVDGVLIYTVVDPTDIAQMGMMRILVDLQVGGMAAAPVATDYPANMQVDWIRVWQKSAAVANATYRITPQNAPTSAVESFNTAGAAGSAIDIAAPTYTPNQLWTLTLQSDGAYTVASSAATGVNLDDPGGAIKNGTPVVLQTANANDEEHWYLYSLGNGWYKFIPKLGLGAGSALTVAGNATANGTALQISTATGATGQAFRLDPPVAPPTISQISATATQTTMTVNWTTSTPTSSVINYGTTVSYGQTFTDAALTTTHSETITGLTAYTLYHFQIVDADQYGQTATSADQNILTEPAILSFTMVPNPVASGQIVTGTVTLADPAPSYGAFVQLSSTNIPVYNALPFAVYINPGETTAIFQFTAPSVSNLTQVPVTAQFDDSIVTSNIGINSPGVIGFSISPSPITGGLNSIGTVTISSPAPAGGLYINMVSSNPTVVPINSKLYFQQGSSSRQFYVPTNPVGNPTNVTVKAVYAGSASAGLQVIPNAIAGFTALPNPVKGGWSVTGTISVTAPAPAGGLVLTLTSTDSTNAPIAKNVIVPAGKTQVFVTVNTHTVTAQKTATLTASVYGTSQSTLITIHP